MEKGGWVAKNATQYNYQGHTDDYNKKRGACSINPTANGCSTILKMEGTSSSDLGDVIIHQDDSGKIVSYTLKDEVSGKPFITMEPLEYKIYITAPDAVRQGYKSASQWNLDIASGLAYGFEGNSSKASEGLVSVVTNPGYWGEVGLGMALSLAPGGGFARWGASSEATTVSVFRKMSVAEADATLGAMKLQPAIPKTNSSKYLSESMSKVEAFQNNGALGVDQKIVEFVLDKRGYDAMMSKAVDQSASKGIDAIKINLEGIDPVSNFRNIGVPPSLLESFNSLVKHVKVVGE